MTREEIISKIEQLKSQKKLQPKDEWELKKLQKDLDKIDNNSSAVGVFVNENNYLEIAISTIRINPFQNRTIFDEQTIDELAQSIEEIGLLQPIVVAKNGDEYVLISGERRLRAYKKLNKQTIPSILKYNVSNTDLEEMALVENLAREDINIYDETEAITKLNKRGLSYSQIATKIGKSKTYVARVMGISNIDSQLLQKVAQNGLYKPKLLEQIAKQDPLVQPQLIDKLIDDNLNLKYFEQKEKEPIMYEEKKLFDGVKIKKNTKRYLTIEINKKLFDKKQLMEYISHL